MDETKYWRLTFDGRQFELAPADEMRGLARNRSIEENIETILLHWGHRFLPGSHVHIVGRESSLCPVADLTGVDRFGRVHLFEIKSAQATAGLAELSQLVSYLLEQPTDFDDVLGSFATSLWHGRSEMALRLAGLVARQRTGVMSAPDLPASARKEQRVAALLAHVAERASERSGTDVTTKRLLELAGLEMERIYGEASDGPLDDVPAAWRRFTERRLRAGWRTTGRRAVWLVAPNVEPALKAAERLIGRGVDLRFVSLDVRDVDPGREWSIRVSFPGGTPWMRQEPFGEALQTVLDRHTTAGRRDGAPGAFIRFSASGGAFGWAGLAGPAEVHFTFDAEGARWDWYSHWWTEGAARAVQQQVNAVRKWLTEERNHPAVLPWGPSEHRRDAFANAALALVDDAWRRLGEVGATALGRWASYEAPEPAGPPIGGQA